MNLIVDFGNSYAKTAIFNKQQLLYSEVFTTTTFEQKLNLITLKQQIKKIGIAAVGKLTKKQEVLLEAIAPIFKISENTTLPFKNNYKTPNTLGTDRIALTAAAFYKYPCANCLVIDTGTCITYDFIDQQGIYHGGAISPGLQMRFKAMHKFTNNLPLIKDTFYNDLIGTDTKSSIISGVVNGISNEIDGNINQYLQKFKDLTVILTGGDGVFLSKRLKSSIFAHSDFLLEGINYLVELNTIND